MEQLMEMRMSSSSSSSSASFSVSSTKPHKTSQTKAVEGKEAYKLAHFIHEPVAL